MHILSWIGLPQEIEIPKEQCFEVARYTTTEFHRHYDQTLDIIVLYHDETQTFYKIIREGTTGPVRRRYAHMR